MAWQTSKMAENDVSCSLAQTQKDKPFQYVSGQKVFAVAPMIDWTDRKKGVDFPQLFRLKMPLAHWWHNQFRAAGVLAQIH